MSELCKELKREGLNSKREIEMDVLNTEERFKKAVTDIHLRPGYQLEKLLFDITDEIEDQMRMQGITRAELARRLNKSKGWVTRVMNRNHNLTLKTINEIMSVLGCKWDITSSSISSDWGDKVVQATITISTSIIKQKTERNNNMYDNLDNEEPVDEQLYSAA
jgi:transcriptional regulator with XRE-family HTH domain